MTIDEKRKQTFMRDQVKTQVFMKQSSRGDVKDLKGAPKLTNASPNQK